MPDSKEREQRKRRAQANKQTTKDVNNHDQNALSKRARDELVEVHPSLAFERSAAGAEVGKTALQKAVVAEGDAELVVGDCEDYWALGWGR